MGSKSKGARGERELVRRLTDAGWWPMKAPSSGSATENDLPDIIAGKDGACLAIEAKRLAGGREYLDKEKMAALHRFARAYGAIALVTVRYDQDTNWYFQLPIQLPQTRAGNRVLDQEVAWEYPTIEELPQLVAREQARATLRSRSSSRGPAHSDDDPEAEAEAERA